MRYFLLPLLFIFLQHFAVSQVSFGVHWGNALSGTSTPTLLNVSSQLQSNNVSWVRSEINWHDIDTALGAPYNWGTVLKNADSLKAKGFSIIGMLRGTPKWYTTNTSTLTAYDQYYAPQDTVQWIRFLDSALSRLNSKITHWEIWNEEDNSYFIAPANVKARKYFYLLRSAYHKIKSMHPTDKVLPGGFTSRMIVDRKSFADSLFAGTMQAQKYCDYMNFHMYEKAASYKNYFTANGINKPVFITETNPWRILGSNGGNSETNTANYLCTWIKDTLIANFNPAVVCWFNLRNWVTQNQIGVCDNCNPDSTAYGLFNSVYNQTSVLPAYKNCLSTITDINEITQQSLSFEAFPNPTSNECNFLIDMKHEENVNMEVINEFGQTVYQQIHYLIPGANEVTINVEAWPAGVYIVRINSEFARQGKKLFFTK